MTFQVLGFGSIARFLVQGAIMVIKIVHKGLLKDTWTAAPTVKILTENDYFRILDGATIKDRLVDRFVWTAEDELEIQLKN